MLMSRGILLVIALCCLAFPAHGEGLGVHDLAAGPGDIETSAAEKVVRQLQQKADLGIDDSGADAELRQLRRSAKIMDEKVKGGEAEINRLCKKNRKVAPSTTATIQACKPGIIKDAGNPDVVPGVSIETTEQAMEDSKKVEEAQKDVIKAEKEAEQETESEQPRSV